MAVGDLITKPGQVEWDGLLIDPYGFWESGIWLTRSSQIDGWAPLWTDTDVATRRGASAGFGLPALTYPTLVDVAVETPELLLDLERAMQRTHRARPICWWDTARDEKFIAWVAPRGLTVSTVDGVQFLAHKVVSLRWLRTDAYLLSLTETPVVVDGSNPTVPNDGAAAAPWRGVVEGPCTGPRFRQMDTGVAWRFDDLVLASGQTLEVDLRALTAVVTEAGEDDVDVWHQSTRDGGGVPRVKPMLIPPGGCPVGFASESGVDEATVYVRDTR